MGSSTCTRTKSCTAMVRLVMQLQSCIVVDLNVSSLQSNVCVGLAIFFMMIGAC